MRLLLQKLATDKHVISPKQLEKFLKYLGPNHFIKQMIASNALALRERESRERETNLLQLACPYLCTMYYTNKSPTCT